MVYGQLHQLIDQKKWDEILQVLREDPTVQSDTKELHRNDLPLHMACEKHAPDDVILEILRHNSDALFHVGRGGNLPLHTACQKNLGHDVIESFIRMNPMALDYRNTANYTPRDFGHSDTYANESLNRPTCCWHQLMQDEIREEAQDKRLNAIQEKITTAIESLSKSNGNIDDMMVRLDFVEKKLRDFEDLRALDLGETVRKLEVSARETMEKIENRLSTVEDDVKAAAARDYMARAASRAHQGDVIKMQKNTAEGAEQLMDEVRRMKSEFSVGIVS